MLLWCCLYLSFDQIPEKSFFTTFQLLRSCSCSHWVCLLRGHVDIVFHWKEFLTSVKWGLPTFIQKTRVCLSTNSVAPNAKALYFTLSKIKYHNFKMWFNTQPVSLKTEREYIFWRKIFMFLHLWGISPLKCATCTSHFFQELLTYGWYEGLEFIQDAALGRQ